MTSFKKIVFSICTLAFSLFFIVECSLAQWNNIQAPRSNVRSSTSAQRSLGFNGTNLGNSRGSRAANIGVESQYQENIEKYQADYQKWLEKKRKAERKAFEKARKKYLDDIKKEEEMARRAKEAKRRRLASRKTKKRRTRVAKSSSKNPKILRQREELIREKKIGFRYELVSMAPNAPKIIDKREFHDVSDDQAVQQQRHIIRKNPSQNDKNIFDRQKPKPKVDEKSNVFDKQVVSKKVNKKSDKVKKEPSVKETPKRRTIIDKLKVGLFE